VKFGFQNCIIYLTFFFTGQGPWKRRLFMKKQRICIFLLCFLCMMVHQSQASDSWQMEMSVTGKQINGQYQGAVILGCNTNEKQIAAPPQAPLYSCTIRIIPVPEWQRSLSVDIQKKQEDYNYWIIAVNPTGNVFSNNSSHAKLSWDNSALELNQFEIREGWDPYGPIIIKDMAELTVMDVQGDSEQYYCIIRKY